MAELTYESVERGERTLPPLRRLWAIFGPDRGDILSVFAFSVVVGGLLLATPIAVQALVGFVAFGGATAPILVLALLLGLGLGLAALMSALQTWIVEILQRRLFVRTLSKLAQRLPHLDPRSTQLWYGPELVNRFLDVVTIQKMTSFLLLDGLNVVLGVVIGLVVLAFYHPLLLAFDLLLLIAVAILVFGPARGGTQTAIRESKAKYAVLGWLQEIARNPASAKQPSAQTFVRARTDALAHEYLGARKSHYTILFRQIMGALFLQVLASVALLGVGGLLVVRGELTLGQLVAAELIVSFVVGSVAKMGKHLEAYYDLMAATDKVGKLLDAPIERSGTERWSKKTFGPVSLRVQQLRHEWPAGRRLIDGLQLDVQPGERVALVGGSGCGKTALLEVIYGLRRFEGGSIEIDSIDLRSVELDALRDRVALAGPIEVFEGTVRDNLTLGREVVTEEVHEALERTGLRQEILALPRGLDAPMNAYGSPLSSEQLRRLMVARAILGRPGLLLVDNLLDGTGEPGDESLVDALIDPSAPWTLVVATRRPEVLGRCSRVIDLNALREVPKLEEVPS